MPKTHFCCQSSIPTQPVPSSYAPIPPVDPQHFHLNHLNTKVNIQDFLQVFKGRGIGKMEDNEKKYHCIVKPGAMLGFSFIEPCALG